MKNDLIPFLLPTIAVLSFVPALFMLYHSLSPYTWPKSDIAYFEDAKVFGLVAVGLVVGAVLFFVELPFSAGGFIISLLFLVLEQLIVLVIVNFPRVRRNGATRFYGLSLGTAMAAGLIMGQYAELFRQNSIDFQVFSVLLIYSVGLELIGVATGSIIGYAVEKSAVHYGVVAAVALQAIFGFLVIPVFSFAPSVITMAFDTGALLFALLVHSYVVLKILPRFTVARVSEKKKRLI